MYGQWIHLCKFTFYEECNLLPKTIARSGLKKKKKTQQPNEYILTELKLYKRMRKNFLHDLLHKPTYGMVEWLQCVYMHMFVFNWQCFSKRKHMQAAKPQVNYLISKHTIKWLVHQWNFALNAILESNWDSLEKGFLVYKTSLRTTEQRDKW